MNYEPESYWSEVAARIKTRESKNVIAGDDEPYYRYKRDKTLALFGSIRVDGKKILEVGCGPGGNLLALLSRGAAELAGVDISGEMIELARQNLPSSIQLQKIDGKQIPYPDDSFDLLFTITVLQHNTDEVAFKALVAEMCRVSAHEIIIFEKVESQIKGTDLCVGRPVEYYKSIFGGHGFSLCGQRFLDIRMSYYACGAIRKIFNRRERREGEPLNRFSVLLETVVLPVTSVLDKVFPWKKDVGMLRFERNRDQN